MEDRQELLVLVLPPQGRLAVAASGTAGLLPGPGLVVALEHKSAAGSQTVAGLLDRERVQQLADALTDWLGETQTVHPATGVAEAVTGIPAHVLGVDGTVETADYGTVARWLASDAEGMDL